MRMGRSFWKKFGYIIGFVTLVGCAGTGAPRENLQFAAKVQPKFVKGFPGKGYEVARFVIQGKSIDEWTEVLETFNGLRSNLPSTPGAYLRLAIDLRKEKCPEFSYNIIKQDANSILYEIRTTNCQPGSDEHSLTRTLYGNINVFSLAYSNKVKELSSDKREEWIRYLSDDRIITK